MGSEIFDAVSGEMARIARRIKPKVHEVSFAYNPCNQRRFLMMKEKEMDEFIQILTEAEPLLKEEQIDDLFKQRGLSDGAQKAIKAALRILNKYKGEMPQGIMSSLAKFCPEYGTYAAPEKTKKEEEDEMEEAKKKAKEELKKEMGNADVTMLKEQVDSLSKKLDETGGELKKTREELMKEKDSRRMEEIRSELAQGQVIGDIDTLVKEIFSIEQVDPTLAKKTIAMQKDVSARLHAAGIFSDVGSSGGGRRYGVEGEAYTELKAKQEEILKKDNSISPPMAWKKAIKDNPELYKKYVSEK